MVNYAENQAGGLFMSEKKIRNLNQQMQYEHYGYFVRLKEETKGDKCGFAEG